MGARGGRGAQGVGNHRQDHQAHCQAILVPDRVGNRRRQASRNNLFDCGRYCQGACYIESTCCSGMGVCVAVGARNHHFVRHLLLVQEDSFDDAGV
jgi:hypothetical protein